jgi:hypothetical protein
MSEEEDGFDDLEEEDGTIPGPTDDFVNNETEVKLPFGPMTPLVLQGQSGIRPSKVLEAHEKWMKNKIKELDKNRLKAIQYLRERGQDDRANEIEMVYYQQLELRKENVARKNDIFWAE